MSYLLLAPDGDPVRHRGEVDWPAAIGPEGRARVALMPSLAVAAYVNDCGFHFPDRYPLNEAGSCLLGALGASPQPYHGNIVFVGWNAENTARGLVEIVPLAHGHANAVIEIHADVRRALAGDAPREMSPSWGEHIRELAEHARTAPTPTLTVRTVKLP